MVMSWRYAVPLPADNRYTWGKGNFSSYTGPWPDPGDRFTRDLYADTVTSILRIKDAKQAVVQIFIRRP